MLKVEKTDRPTNRPAGWPTKLARPGGMLASHPFGFTLTELLVVILIILLISITVLPTVLGALEERKFGDATRAIQAALAAARDRALVSNRIVGVRLVRDNIDPLDPDPSDWDVSRLVYVGVPEPFSVGIVDVTPGSPSTVTAAASPNPQWDTPGRVPAAYYSPGSDGQPGQAGVDDNGDMTVDNAPELGWAGSDDVLVAAYIRFNFTGRLYAIDSATSGTTLDLLGTEPAPPDYPVGTRYQIFLPPAPLAGTEPVLLPEGVIIDVRGLDAAAPYNVPRSRYIPAQADPGSNMDILFGPHGFVVGPGATKPLIHFWVSARGDANVTDPHRLVTLVTRTGAVQVYDDPNPLSPYGPVERSLGVSLLDVP